MSTNYDDYDEEKYLPLPLPKPCIPFEELSEAEKVALIESEDREQRGIAIAEGYYASQCERFESMQLLRGCPTPLEHRALDDSSLVDVNP